MDAEFVKGTIILGVHHCDLQPNAVVSSQGLLLRCTVGSKTVETSMVYSPLAHVPFETQLELPTDPSSKFLTIELIDNNTWLQSRSVGKVTLVTSASAPPLQKKKQYNMYKKNTLTASLTLTLSLLMTNNVLLSEQNRHLYYPAAPVQQGENPALDCFELELGDDDFMYLTTENLIGLPGQPAPATTGPGNDPNNAAGTNLLHSNPRLVAPYLQNGNLFHNLHLRHCVAATTKLQNEIASHHNNAIELIGTDYHTGFENNNDPSFNNGPSFDDPSFNANNPGYNNYPPNNNNYNNNNPNTYHPYANNNNNNTNLDDDDFEVVDFDTAMTDEVAFATNSAYPTTTTMTTAIHGNPNHLTSRRNLAAPAPHLGHGHELYAQPTGYGYPTVNPKTGKIQPPPASSNLHSSNNSASNSLNQSGHSNNGSYTGSNTAYPVQKPISSIPGTQQQQQQGIGPGGSLQSQQLQQHTSTLPPPQQPNPQYQHSNLMQFQGQSNQYWQQQQQQQYRPLQPQPQPQQPYAINNYPNSYYNPLQPNQPPVSTTTTTTTTMITQLNSIPSITTNGPMTAHNVIPATTVTTMLGPAGTVRDPYRVDLPYKTEHGGFGVVSLPATHPLAQQQLEQQRLAALQQYNQAGAEGKDKVIASTLTTAQVFANAKYQHDLHQQQQQQLLLQQQQQLLGPQQFHVTTLIHPSPQQQQQQQQQQGGQQGRDVVHRPQHPQQPPPPTTPHPQYNNQGTLPFLQFNTNSSAHTAPPQQYRK